MLKISSSAHEKFVLRNQELSENMLLFGRNKKKSKGTKVIRAASEKTFWRYYCVNRCTLPMGSEASSGVLVTENGLRVYYDSMFLISVGEAKENWNMEEITQNSILVARQRIQIDRAGKPEFFGKIQILNC